MQRWSQAVTPQSACHRGEVDRVGLTGKGSARKYAHGRIDGYRENPKTL